MRSVITEFIFDTGEHFLGRTTSGIRVGMNGIMAFEVPTGHEMYSEVLALTPETVEAFLDAQIEQGRIDLRSIR